MPLTKVFRMGPTPQRVTKGYILAGDAAKVAEFQATWSGHSLAGFEILGSKSTRAVHLRGEWRLLANPEIRTEYRDTLIDAVRQLLAHAKQAGLRLLPSATCSTGPGSWPEWTCADVHEVSVTSTTEAEVVSNAFRAASGVVIALSGRAAIDRTLGRAHSCRLLHSTDQLFARYVTSAAPRNLRQVADELRRADGIQSLEVMDVYPVANEDRLSCTVKAVDAQAFVGTTMSHALLIQAMSMHYRRTARRGGRVGRMPDQLVQRHRAAAISLGLTGRVRPDGQRSESGEWPSTTSLEVLARDLVGTLEPEFGSLQTTFAEVAPVIGWAVDGRLPRGENEYLARMGLLGIEQLGDALDEPAYHTHLSQLGAGSSIAGQWELLTTQPPRTSRGANGRPRDEVVPRANAHDGERRRPQRREDRRGADDGARRLESLLGVKDSDEAVRRDLVRDLIAGLRNPMDELVPWDRDRSEDVRSARSAGRPPADAQRRVAYAAFSSENDRVRTVLQLAGQRGWALLALEGRSEEAFAFAAKLEGFLAHLAECSGAILGVAKFRDKSGAQREKTELVLVRRSAR